MVLIGSGTNIGATGGAITAYCVLSRTVRGILGTRGVVAVAVGTFTAIGTGVVAAMAGAVVILPSTVRIGAMAGAVVHQLITVTTVFVPITAIPFGIGGTVTRTGTHQLIAVVTILIPVTTGPFGIISSVGTVIIISAATTGATAAITALGTVTAAVSVILTENTAALVVTAVGTPMTDTVNIVRPLFIVQRIAVSAFTVRAVTGCQNHHAIGIGEIGCSVIATPVVRIQRIHGRF